MNHTRHGKISIGAPGSIMRKLTEKDYIVVVGLENIWLCVSKEHLKILQIQEEITSCSKVMGDNVFLKDGHDIDLFIKEWMTKTGINFYSFVKKVTTRRCHFIDALEDYMWEKNK